MAIKKKNNHNIQIADWIWQWAKEESGLENPAPFLRDMLTERVSDVKNSKTPSKKLDDKKRLFSYRLP